MEEGFKMKSRGVEKVKEGGKTPHCRLSWLTTCIAIGKV